MGVGHQCNGGMFHMELLVGITTNNTLKGGIENLEENKFLVLYNFKGLCNV